MDLLAIEDAIYNALSPEAGMNVVWDEPNAPRVGLPYVRLKISGPYPLGPDELISSGSLDTYTVQGFRKFNLSINVYGDPAPQTAINLQTAFSKPSVQDVLFAANVGVADVGGIRDLTQLIDETFERRCQFDAHLTTVETIDVNLHDVVEVSAAGNITNEDSIVFVDTIDASTSP